MNENKVCFITCVNDKQLYQESLYYINNLDVPEGIEIECISVENAESMTQGYNKAMKQSDAKYKVYLHQDVLIIHKSFIRDIMNIFQNNNELGLLGVIGAKSIPTNGVWRDAQKKFGKVYENQSGTLDLITFGEVSSSYETVQAIDGLLMITQYDIPWREDIFVGWHFYDASQSVEFIKAGYEVGIPRLDEVWCLHDNGEGNREDLINTIDRKKFLSEYYLDIFPLVSVLIPTYNRPDYFQLALDSVLTQTYKNIEIIIGDDSTNNDTEILVREKYLSEFPNIKYFHNEKNLGQFDNDLKLMDMAKGDFVNFLMDDDLFEPTKIEKMMNYFINDLEDEISLVTSHRGIIDDKGRSRGIFGNTDEIFQKDSILDGRQLGEFVLKNNYNCIGEPTTVLFRKTKLTEPFGTFNGRINGCNVDQASWLNLLSNHKAVYINEVLSLFRIHQGQQQNDLKIRLMGFTDYIHQILTSREKGYLLNVIQYREIINNALALCNKHIIEPFQFQKQDFAEYKEFQYYYNKLMELNENLGGELPLVSILIPAYNQTNFLKEALESAVNQTYPNIEIIIGDDSTNSEVEEFLGPYLERYSYIRYFKNERKIIDYGYENHVNSFKKSKGEYINFLNHDDILHPRKIEKMITYFLENPNVTLVTSARNPIDENGNLLSMDGAYSRLYNKDTILSGYELSRKVIWNLTNFIGEPTTVLFKRNYIREDELFYFNGTRIRNIGDVASWLTVLQYGDVVYISEALSYFRIHSEQNSNKPDVYISGVIAWYQLINLCYETGIIKNTKEYKEVLNNWLNMFLPVIKIFISKVDYVSSELKNNLINSYYDAIRQVVNKGTEKNYKCPVCNEEVERFIPYQYQKHKTDFTAKFEIIGSDIQNFTCPNCYCHDRTRHIFLYFNRLKFWDTNINSKTILHIAPEKHIQKRILKLNPEEYICGDLYPTDASITKLDVTNMSFNDGYFDFIICNHVLEHITNDFNAICELFRVLKPGGYAVFQTPYSPILKNSYENASIDTEAKRKEYFGQSDHVRIYGVDFFERLKSVGFKLRIKKNDDLFTREECKMYGVNYKEDLILVTK